MDIVLGVSVDPSAVQMVLVEGENGDGVTVDQDGFAVDAHSAGVPDRVISAILGTREGAQEGGYRLASTGVVIDDQAQAQQLRAALTAHRVHNVTLVSAFLAAAALTQAVGGAVGYARTALLFVEPATATLAVVNSADGAITEVHRMSLRGADASATAELIALTVGADGLASRPDGLFVVGSGTDVGTIKQVLETTSPIPVSAPEEPETALARGAALASAHAPLFESVTAAVAWARDPGTGAVDPGRMALGYAYLPAAPMDYDATVGEQALAYSAVGGDYPEGVYPPLVDRVDGRSDLGDVRPTRPRRPFLLAGSALAALFVAAVATLVIALAVGIRPMAAHQPVPRPHIVVPAEQAPAPQPKAEQPAPAALPPAVPPAPSAQPAPPPAPEPPPAPAPAVEPVPPPTAQPPVPAARQVPAPAAPPSAPEVVPTAPAPAPQAPAPAPVPAAPIPIPIPILLPAPIPAAPPVSPPAASPTAPKLPAPTWPPIFTPPKQAPQPAPPKVGGGHSDGAPGWPGRGGGRDAGAPGRPGGKGGGGGLFPGWPGGGGEQRGGLPGLFGGHGGLPF